MLFNKVAAYFKKIFQKSWQFIVGILAALVAVLVIKKVNHKDKRLDELRKKETEILKKSHDLELNNIIDAHDKFDKKIESAFKSRDDKLANIWELKNKRIEALVEEDPEEITRKLAALTGISEVDE